MIVKRSTKITSQGLIQHFPRELVEGAGPPSSLSQFKYYKPSSLSQCPNLWPRRLHRISYRYMLLIYIRLLVVEGQDGVDFSPEICKDKILRKLNLLCSELSLVWPWVSLNSTWIEPTGKLSIFESLMSLWRDISGTQIGLTERKLKVGVSGFKFERQLYDREVWVIAVVSRKDWRLGPLVSPALPEFEIDLSRGNKWIGRVHLALFLFLFLNPYNLGGKGGLSLGTALADIIWDKIRWRSNRSKANG